MGEQDDLGALVREFQDGRCNALDTRRVGDLAIRHRHIEIDAHKDALAVDVTEIVEGLERRHEIISALMLKPARTYTAEQQTQAANRRSGLAPETCFACARRSREY